MTFPSQVVRVVSEIIYGNTDNTLLSGETEQAGKYCHLCSKDMDMTVKQSSPPIMETNVCSQGRKEWTVRSRNGAFSELGKPCSNEDQKISIY